jgi:hypothetical protein
MDTLTTFKPDTQRLALEARSAFGQWQEHNDGSGGAGAIRNPLRCPTKQTKADETWQAGIKSGPRNTERWKQVDTVLKWLYGLLSVGISAAASGVTASVVAPESFNFSHTGLEKLGALCAVNALLAVAMYLKQSPLPAIQTTTQTTTLETKTVTNPAPPAPPGSIGA